MEPTELTTLLLVRHGHVPGIEPATFRGRTDIELTERGVHEAHLTAEWIASDGGQPLSTPVRGDVVSIRERRSQSSAV